MGGGGGKGKTPDVPAVAAPPQAPTMADESVRQAGNDARRQRLAASGRSSTILTGGQGLGSTANTQKKQVLGA